MKTFTKPVVVAIIMSFGLTACAGNMVSCSRDNGETKTIKLNTNGQHIKAIDASSAFVVNIQKGSASSAVATVSSRFANDVILELKADGELKVGMHGNVNKKGSEILEVSVVCPTIEGIDCSSAAQVNVNSDFTVNNLSVNASSASSVDGSGKFTVNNGCTIEASSAATIQLDMNVEGNVDAECSSAARISISGRTSKLDVEASSAATVNCLGLIAKQVTVDGSGAATVRVYAQEKLNGEVSGAASLIYDSPEGGTFIKKDASASAKKR